MRTAGSFWERSAAGSSCAPRRPGPQCRPAPALFTVCHADIETFTGDLERARARAAVTRRLCTIAGSRKYAVEELLDHSPAAYVRRPRVDYESHAVGLDRNKLGALLTVAGLGGKVVTIPLALRGARAIDLVT